MFGVRVQRAWEPVVGASFAKRLRGAYAPLGALLVLMPAWWAVGIASAVSSGYARGLLRTLNGSFLLVALRILLLTLVLVRRVAASIRRVMEDRGFDSRRSPRLFTTSGFRQWLLLSGIPADLSLEILSE